ncbi:MAG: glycosyltransferase [Chloroflexi bacterium]|nr:glycosyltransferase [Chloroflexota bacterium]
MTSPNPGLPSFPAQPELRVAVLTVHGCPVVRAGEKDAGGMNVYVLATVHELASRGVVVDVFTRSHDPSDPQVIDLAPGARVVHLEAGPVRPEKNGAFDLLPEFTDRVVDFVNNEGGEYDVIVSHYWLSGLVGEQLSARWALPHITSFHTLAEVKRRARPGEVEIPERAAGERQIARNADRVIAWSAHERDLLSDLYGADKDHVLIIPPGVDTKMFRPHDKQASRKKLGLPGSGKILMYVGRVERLKGIEILIQAVAGMEEEDDVTLLIVGGADSDPERHRLNDVVDRLGITDRVKFLPSVKQEQLPEYYSAADVCVFPSYYESFGLAALESMACGTPVVASRVGGLPSIVREGETGYLIPTRCPAAFIQRIEILITNDHLRTLMGRAARERALELGWGVAVDRLIAVFCGLAEERVLGTLGTSSISAAD